MNEEQKCELCESRLSLRWTDTHGVAVCLTCGMPYRVYHYMANDGPRIDGHPITRDLPDDCMPMARAYWQEKRRMVYPGVYDIGISRSRGSRTYSGATRDDMNEFEEFYQAHPELQPPPQPETQEAA